MPPDLHALSVEALIAARVRAEVADLLREQLAPISARLDALTAAVPPMLVSVEEASRRLSKSTARIRSMAAAGEIAACKVGRSWRIDLGSLRPTPPEDISRLAREARGGR